MIRRLFTMVAMVALLAVPAVAAPPGTACSDLKALTIPTVTITAAAAMPAGSFTPPGSRNPLTLPAFCRVEGVARPVADSEIRFEVWIPPVQAWNGKFQGVGNGGYAGSISYPAMAAALQIGYATASTDTGHAGDDLRFGQGHPEKVIDWAYRAIHVTAEVSKLIVRDHTGRFPDHSYFVGCSTGGHQALSEAQRYPEDYDGIVAGSPGYDRIRQIASYLWAWTSMHDEEGASILPASKLPLITKSAVAACDANDGLKDGLIDDPRMCRFDPAALLCKSGDNATCLTAPQVQAVKKVYSDLRNPRTGELIFPGWSPGSEAFGDQANAGWRGFVVEPKEPMRVGVYRYFLFDDPNWDYRTLDWDRDIAYADAKLGFMSAIDPNLTAFKQRGGKLLMHTGWADPVALPKDILKYYEAATKTMGGIEKTQDFFRFFMAPGMGHCGGGPGPNTYDSLNALEQWVEKGIAPSKIIASHSANGVVDRTRPLCPYPQVARWKGTGSSDDAANFVCTSVK
jgi:feruloyl esterase